MSFGWSAGDIVSALKVLYQIGVALKDSGGASSEFQDTLSFLQTFTRTLQHLNALQAARLDQDLAENLREQCEHIRVPLQTFLGDVGRRFEPALGVESRRNRILATPQKIQWAISTSKKVKRLQDRVAVPMTAVSLLLGQQIVQSTLQLPIDIQERMAHSIDAGVTRLHGQLDSLSASQSTSTDLVIRNIQQSHLYTGKLIHMQALEGRAQCSSLHRKLDQVEASLGAMRDSLVDLSTIQSNTNPSISDSEAERAARNILGSIWLLLSSLQRLIRELVILLAPYLVVFYQNTVQHFLEYGDHFLFEDVIGRIRRLPCAQFQHWSIFYDFLVDSFQDTPGLSLVLTEKFVMMNAYNSYPVTSEAWTAVIQPKSKITMAMILDGKGIRQGRCADPSCSGRVALSIATTTYVCPICDKHIFILKESKQKTFPEIFETTISGSSHPQKSPSIRNPRPKRLGSKLMTSTMPLEKEIALFKRVMWHKTHMDVHPLFSYSRASMLAETFRLGDDAKSRVIFKELFSYLQREEAWADHEVIPQAARDPFICPRYEVACARANEGFYGSHPLRLCIKVEFCLFLYDYMNQKERSRKLAKSTIAEVYNAPEGMDDNEFEAAAESVKLLGRMMKRG